MSPSQSVADVPAGTHFAAPERASYRELLQLSEQALANPILAAVLETVSGYVLVIDEHRQIVAANQAILSLLEAKRGDSLLGLRPGEALNCVSAARGPSGCGTSKQCRHCGAVAGILAAQVSNEPVEGTCTVVSVKEGLAKCLQLRLRITPLPVARTPLYVLTFHDVTATRRRELLEQLFLHDLANLVGGLVGWTEELLEVGDRQEIVQVSDLVHRIEEYLREHRLLLRVESGELEISRTVVPLAPLVENLRVVFQTNACGHDRQLRIDLSAAPDTVFTDEQLLHRVLCNLLKNAFEAVPKGGTVRFGVIDKGDRCTFEVRNEGVLSQEVADLLFKSQFSTKEPSRGLGTFAIQLLGEQCLGGEITFESSQAEGTLFRFTLPKLAADQQSS